MGSSWASKLPIPTQGQGSVPLTQRGRDGTKCHGVGGSSYRFALPGVGKATDGWVGCLQRAARVRSAHRPMRPLSAHLPETFVPFQYPARCRVAVDVCLLAFTRSAPARRPSAQSVLPGRGRGRALSCVNSLRSIARGPGMAEACKFIGWKVDGMSASPRWRLQDGDSELAIGQPFFCI